MIISNMRNLSGVVVLCEKCDGLIGDGEDYEMFEMRSYFEKIYFHKNCCPLVIYELFNQIPVNLELIKSVIENFVRD